MAAVGPSAGLAALSRVSSRESGGLWSLLLHLESGWGHSSHGECACWVLVLSTSVPQPPCSAWDVMLSQSRSFHRCLRGGRRGGSVRSTELKVLHECHHASPHPPPVTLFLPILAPLSPASSAQAVCVWGGGKVW